MTDYLDVDGNLLITNDPYQGATAERGMISASDLSLIYATDSVEEAIAHIRSKAIEPFGLKRVAHIRRHFPWLGERGLLGAK